MSEIACSFCDRPVQDGWTMYGVNSSGVFGLAEMYACQDCMRKAEAGSKLADLRDTIYAEDFRA